MTNTYMEKLGVFLKSQLLTVVTVLKIVRAIPLILKLVWSMPLEP
jgi:hypothetical protein